MRKGLMLLFVVLFSLGLMTGCGSSEKTADTGSDKETGTEKTEGVSLAQQPLKIGVLSIEDNLPLFLAEAEDRFKQEGLDVKLIPFPSAVERDAALQAGQIDGESADIVAACLLKKGGTDVRIASITLGVKPEEGRFVLLGSPKSNFKSPKDLANVPIAISENTIIEYVTDKLLTNNGLKADEIKKLSVPKMPIRVQMLTESQVQAALLPDPMATLAEKQGAKVILDDTKSDENISQVVFLFRKESIGTKKEAIQKLISVYAKAGSDLTANPDQYRSLLIEKAKIPEPIKDSYKSPTFSAPQVPTVEEITGVVDWMVEKKLLEKPYTYDELVDKTLIQ